MVNVDFYSA